MNIARLSSENNFDWLMSRPSEADRMTDSERQWLGLPRERPRLGHPRERLRRGHLRERPRRIRQGLFTSLLEGRVGHRSQPSDPRLIVCPTELKGAPSAVGKIPPGMEDLSSWRIKKKFRTMRENCTFIILLGSIISGSNTSNQLYSGM